MAHRRFKTTQFSAFDSHELIFSEEELRPEEVLRDTLVKTDAGEWLRLDEPEVVAAHIWHPERLEAPLTMLSRLIERVTEISCEARYSWKPVKAPHRFLSQADTIEALRGMSILSTLIAEKVASLEQLQSVYSMDDAFRIFDDFTVSNVNKALSQEDAMKEAKRNR